MTGIQLEELAILDPTSGDMVKFANPTRKVYAIEVLTSEMSEGTSVIDGKIFDLSCSGSFTKDAQEQLSNWASNGVSLQFSGYSKDGMILQGIGSIKVNETDTGKVSKFSFSVPAEGGYTDEGIHSSGTSMSHNALALHKWNNLAGWDYSDVDLADQWVSIKSGEVSKKVFFPFHKTMFMWTELTGMGELFARSIDLSGSVIDEQKIINEYGFKPHEDAVFVEVGARHIGYRFGICRPCLTIGKPKRYTSYEV